MAGLYRPFACVYEGCMQSGSLHTLVSALLFSPPPSCDDCWWRLSPSLGLCLYDLEQEVDHRLHCECDDRSIDRGYRGGLIMALRKRVLCQPVRTTDTLFTLFLSLPLQLTPVTPHSCLRFLTVSRYDLWVSFPSAFSFCRQTQ